MPRYRLGMNCRMYRNSGTYESPTWAVVNNVRDLTLNVEKGEADLTTRANLGWEAIVGTLKKGSLEFSMVWDTEDENFDAYQTSFFTNDDDEVPIDVLVLDGPVETATSKGLRATVGVMKFSRKENLAEGVTVDVSMKPTYSENAPRWGTVTELTA